MSVIEDMDAVFRFELVVPLDALDGNQHVNNVAYVGWMQEAAIRHATATGCARVTRELGAIWVVRTHRIEYFIPAFAAETLQIVTWVADLRKVRSLRRYQVIRSRDQALLAEGETDWVFVDARTGKPRLIPEEVRKLFVIGEPGPNVARVEKAV